MGTVYFTAQIHSSGLQPRNRPRFAFAQAGARPMTRRPLAGERSKSPLVKVIVVAAQKPLPPM